LQVVAQGGGKTYTSNVYTVKSGFLPNGLPTMKVSDKNASALFSGGGFTVNCTGIAGTTGISGSKGTSYAFIFDKDGDMVWALDLTNTVATGCSRARISPDAKYMWAGNFANVSTSGALMRVTMDGLGSPKNYAFPGRSHDFSFLPGGHVLFFQQQNGGGYTNNKEGPDWIKDLDPETGTATTVYDETTDFATEIANSSGAHTNFAAYIPELKAVSFSMRHISTVGLLSYPAGKLLTVFGGTRTAFSNMTWDVQHGHDVRSDHLWIFNNNGTGGGASVLGFRYDIASKMATQTLNYSSGVASTAFGDVTELPNTNLFVTYSTSGVFHEISMTGTLLREISTTTPLGYSEHLATLYGPPPPFDR